MIRIDETYSEYFDTTDIDYPGGKAIDASSPDTFDGTEYKVRWMNDVVGAFQALVVAAFGSIDRISNKPDSVAQSDVLDSIQELIARGRDIAKVVVRVQGAETIIPWKDMDIFYDENRVYAPYPAIQGKNLSFLPPKAWSEDDGIHIYMQHYDDDGNIIDGTYIAEWGLYNWGEFDWGSQATMKINLIIKEVKEVTR